MESVVAKETLARVGYECYQLGESPRWDEQEQALWWVDILRHRLYRWQAESGVIVKRDLGQEVGCFSLCHAGGLILGGQSGLLRLPELTSAHAHVLHAPEADRPWQRFNDGRCDPAGRFIAGTMNPRKDEQFGSFYQLTANALRPLLGKSWTCNGLAFSPDGQTLYWSDTPNRTIYRCAYDVTSGEVGASELFYLVPEGWGRPDGACVDSEGCYWSAQYGGGRLLRLSPQGELLECLLLPVTNPTMPCFGGPELNSLFITSAAQQLTPQQLRANPWEGALLRLETRVTGLVESRYRE